MRIGYADPPYIGQSKKHYGDHPDYAGEVDHAHLIDTLNTYDGWVLHLSAPSLGEIMPLVPSSARVGAWVKPFAAFKRNVSPAYAWEPVIFQPARRPVTPSPTGIVMRDWVSEPITMKRGLTGAKPQAVCHWAFEIVGARVGDDLHDMFPGSGAVSRAWETWSTMVTQLAKEA